MPSNTSCPVVTHRLYHETDPSAFRGGSMSSGHSCNRLLHHILSSMGANKVGIVLAPNQCGSTFFRRSCLTRHAGTMFTVPRSLFIRNGILCCDRCSNGQRHMNAICHQVSSRCVSPVAFCTNSLLKMPRVVSSCETKGITVMGTPKGNVTSSGNMCCFIPRVVGCCLNRRPVLGGTIACLPVVGGSLSCVARGLPSLIVGSMSRSKNCKIVFKGALSGGRLSTVGRTIGASPHQFVTRRMVSFGKLGIFRGNERIREGTSLHTFILCNSRVAI